MSLTNNSNFMHVISSLKAPLSTRTMVAQMLVGVVLIVASSTGFAEQGKGTRSVSEGNSQVNCVSLAKLGARGIAKAIEDGKSCELVFRDNRISALNVVNDLGETEAHLGDKNSKFRFKSKVNLVKVTLKQVVPIPGSDYYIVGGNVDESGPGMPHAASALVFTVNTHNWQIENQSHYKISPETRITAMHRSSDGRVFIELAPGVSPGVGSYAREVSSSPTVVIYPSR